MSSQVIERREPDLADSEVAYQKLEAELRAMPANEVQQPNADLQDAAVAALALVDIARDPKRLPRFSALPEDEFPKHAIDRLERIALASWYVQTQVMSEGARQTGAKVDVSLMEASEAHLAEMLKLIEYYVGDVGDVAAELADIRSGTGYHDRGSDLVRAAALFDAWEDELKEDRRLYSPESGKRAREYADAILAALRSDAQDAANWRDKRDRAWSMLTASYRDVETTGAWLFRKQPEHATLFKPLRTMMATVRPRRRRRRGRNEEPAPAATV